MLRAFQVDDHGLTLTDLVERTGLARSTVHRVAGDLVATGLVARDGGRYRLGRALFELGMRASVERGLLEIATPFLEDLYERTHETVHLGVREGAEVVYVAKVGGHRQARMSSRVGGRMPLHCTAIGKALLAHAPEVDALLAGPLERRAPRTITARSVLREQLAAVVEAGVAYEFEESSVGLVCVASPIVGPDGRVEAALSVAGPITRFHPRQHASAVRAAAQGVAATLSRRDALRGGASH